MADGGQMWAQMNAGPADPIRSFAAGASLATQFQSITQAAQAQSFTNTLNILKLNNEREDRAREQQNADRAFELAKYNADTNRLNALRPRTSSAGGYGGGGTNGLIQLPDGSFGVDVGPADGSTGVPHGTEMADLPTDQPAADGLEVTPLGAASDMPEQMPTSGQGDMTEAPPEAQRVPQTAGLTLPIQGNNNGSNPLLPSPTGQAPAASPTAGQLVNVNGRMVRRLPPNTTITQGPRGTTMTTRTPAAGKPKEVAQQDYNAMAALVNLGGLELTGVDGFDTNGRPQPKFEKPKEKKVEALYDFDQLKEETQAKIVDSFKKVAFPVPPEGFTDEEKMAAVGIVLPPEADPAAKEAAAAKMTPELWTRGYNILKEKALANREQAVTEHAALLTSVAGKTVTVDQVKKMLPDYEPPKDTRPGTPNMRMTETGDTTTDGTTAAAGAGTPAAPASAPTQITADQRRELGLRAKELRQQVVDGGIDTTTGLPKNKAANDELMAIQDKLKGSTAAAAPAPTEKGGDTPPASGAIGTAPFTGKIPTLGEAKAAQEAERQKPLMEDDSKQWTAAKEKAITMVERIAKNRGVRPEVILATLATDAWDSEFMSELTSSPEWSHGFTRKASTPGLNGVGMPQIIKALLQDEGLLKKKYGITLDQLAPAGNKAPLQVTSVKAK